MTQRKEHWEKVYQSKKFEEVSWYQSIPTTSIDFLATSNLPKNAKIIDIGGGESNFVNYLLAEGYENITVLDISEIAIQKKKMELGENASKVHWIVSDIVDFQSTMQYDFWHDRATFHFLTNEADIEKYLQLIQNRISPNGILTIGTFSETGPTKCSGLEIKQYSESSLSKILNNFFKKIKCINSTHQTPFQTIQNFIFCSFRKLTF